MLRMHCNYLHYTSSYQLVVILGCHVLLSFTASISLSLSVSLSVCLFSLSVSVSVSVSVSMSLSHSLPFSLFPFLSLSLTLSLSLFSFSLPLSFPLSLSVSFSYSRYSLLPPCIGLLCCSFYLSLFFTTFAYCLRRNYNHISSIMQLFIVCFVFE